MARHELLVSMIAKFSKHYFQGTVARIPEVCEYPEINCVKGNGTVYYRFLHFRVRLPKRNGPVSRANSKIPPVNVALIVLDSVSLSAARRALPRTLNYLQTSYGAHVFEGYNVVGENSLPNGAVIVSGDLRQFLTFLQVCFLNLLVIKNIRSL